MPSTLLNAEEAWQAVEYSIKGCKDPGAIVDKGSFVPVIGPQVALTCLEEIDSQQLREVSSARESLITLGGRAADPKVAHYLARLAECSTPEACQSPVSDSAAEISEVVSDSSALVGRFQLSLATVACRLNQVWARGMLWQPEPLSPLQSYPTSYDLISKRDMALLFKELLSAADELDASVREEPKDSVNHNIRIDLVRPRLLRLLAEVAQDDLWDEWPEFLDDHSHRSIIKKWKRITGLKVLRDGRPSATTDAHSIALRHLLWLEDLIWHTALCRTTAHRSGPEMAFELSLFKRGIIDLEHNDVGLDIPKLYELGFLYSSPDETLGRADALVNILGLSDKQTDGTPGRSPSPFHVRLARLIALNQANSGSVAPSVVLTSCWDLEMQRALAATLPSFCVLVPVWLPRAGQGGGDSAARSDPAWMAVQVDGLDDDGEFKIDSDPGRGYRLLAASVRDESSLGYDKQKLSVNWNDKEMRGPLLVCIGGSPLMECGDWCNLSESQLRAIGSLNFDDRRHIRHRLIIDEADLLGYLEHGPLPAAVAELLHAKRLFFFGYPASSLSERVHYFALARQSGNPGGEAAGPFARYSLGKTTAFGELALKKWHVGWADIQLESVMERVIAGADSLMTEGGAGA